MIVDKIFDSGVAYISFFDLRAAESARTHLNGTNFKGRPLDVHFAFPNPNSDRTEPPPPKENQGSIKLVFRGFVRMPPHDQMYDFFSQFGQVRDIHHTNNPNVYILSYYDCRACMEVVRNTPADAFGEGTVLADLAWDKFLPIPLEEQHSRGGVHPSSYQENNFSSAPYGYKELYSHNPSGARADFNYQPYNETPSNTQDLIEKAQQAQELLNYIQTQTTIKLPESNSYYNNTAQPSHSDKAGVYYQNTPSSYAPSESQGYYPPTAPVAASQYTYSPAQTHAGQSNYYPSNPNSNPTPQSYSSGKSNHADNTYGYYAPPQDVSSNCYQSTSNLAAAPQENAPNTEVNQLLQLLAQANSKHSIK
ncbi:hypothetical protein DSO57_1001546 [Entomophthora muscae]|uniref:Uncharacterized protein n=1 Tax=Entomophthora muscae TaxID=34485 RepID=A0ACC2RP29_9FUNG|nr:hypothetical protein DSO57_1001546 [Entomophthora muscae]